MVQKTQKSASDKPGKAPVSTHPLFGALVALWFAALLGLGSAVLPGRVVESFVGATGLPAILPAAAPPLGLTARILIAVAASGLGVAIGLLIARRINSQQAPSRSSGIDFASVFGKRKKAVRRPLSIRDELGEEPADGAQAASPAFPTGRRRALAMTEDHGMDGTFGDASYLGESVPATADTVTDGPPIEPLILDDSHDAAEWEPVAPEESAGFADIDEELEVEELEAADETSAAPAQDELSPIPTADPLPETPAETEAPEAPSFSTAFPEHKTTSAPHPVTQRPLNQLGMTELVERLAHAIQDRQARTRAADASRDTDRAPQQMPVPAALRPIAFDNGEGFEDEHGTAPFSLPLQASGRAFAPPAPYRDTPPDAAGPADGWDETEQGEEEEGDPDNAGYSSLLSLQKPFLPEEDGEEEEAVEISSAVPEAPRFDAPAPGSATPLRTPRTPADTEQALRDALANLQRISGAA